MPSARSTCVSTWPGDSAHARRAGHHQHLAVLAKPGLHHGQLRPTSGEVPDLRRQLPGNHAGRLGMRQVKARIPAQNRGVQLAQRHPGIDAKLIAQLHPHPLIPIQRVSLPIRPVQREHQQPSQLLPRRMGADQLLQRHHRGTMLTKSQPRRPIIAPRRQPQLPQPLNLRLHPTATPRRQPTHPRATTPTPARCRCRYQPPAPSAPPAQTHAHPPAPARH